MKLNRPNKSETVSLPLRFVSSPLGRVLFKENRFVGIGFNPNHPLSSMVNYAKVKAGLTLKSSRATGYPIHVTIEPTNICNLHCPLCATGTGTLGRPKGRMTLEQFQSIVDEIKRYVLRFEIAGMGEPLIHTDIFRMIRYAADAGLWVHLDSNIMLINTEQKVRELIDSGLGLLNMSIDGATQDTYEKYRIGGKLDVVLGNVKALIAEKRRRGVIYPEIVCQVVVTKNNEHEVEEIRRMAVELGVDRFVPKAVGLIRTPGSDIIPESLSDRFMPTDAKFRRYKTAQEVVYRNACSSLYKTAFIFWNGDVTTCCHDARGENNMGNIFKAGSFLGVWNSSRYQRLRHQVNTDIRKAEPLCSICPMRARVG
ncbi:MAG: radical SAM protein [Nitrospirae bacterium]|nr:radical SAM protein [Nitrospirota bacterium]